MLGWRFGGKVGVGFAMGMYGMREGKLRLLVLGDRCLLGELFSVYEKDLS